MIKIDFQFQSPGRKKRKRFFSETNCEKLSGQKRFLFPVTLIHVSFDSVDVYRKTFLIHSYRIFHEEVGYPYLAF